MPGIRRILALGVVLGVAPAGCSEEPSFRVRWRIAEPRLPDVDPDQQPNPEDAPALESPLGCTQVGINEIRLEAYVVEEGADGQEEELLVGRRTRPCFPRGFTDPEASARGFPLPPGEYRIKLRGIRRDGAEWSTPEGQDEEIATFTFDGVVIEEEKTIRLMDGNVDPVIPTPPQCDDGVDNDGDGFVDSSDPSCRAVGADLEGSQVFPHQFQLRVSFLDGNPNIVDTAHCQGLGVDKVRVYDPNQPGRCLASNGVEAEDADCLAVVSCSNAISQNTFFSTSITDLPEIAVVATARLPQNLVPVPGLNPPPINGVAVTRPQLVAVSPTGSTIIEPDFADSDFFEPIESRAEILFRLFPGSVNNSLCKRQQDGVGVEITQLAFSATDAHGGALPTPIAMELPVEGPLDGTPIPCKSSVYTTEALPWGGYSITAEALSPEGDVCFEYTAPYPLAPGTGTGFGPDGGLMVFTRANPVPQSCQECSVDSECGTLRCDTVTSLCVECLDDSDCTGQVCRNTVCEPV